MFDAPFVFIGMETSGMLRSRFAARGFRVLSCDLLPAEDGCEYDPIEMTGHYVGDVFDCLDKLWWGRCWPAFAVFHPDCTFLTNSAAWAFPDPDYARFPGVGYHQKVKPETVTGKARRDQREIALNDVRKIMHLKIRRKVMENPVGSIGTMIRKPSQVIQPHQFGEDASKGTCLWYFNENAEPLTDMQLVPTLHVPPRLVTKSGSDLSQTHDLYHKRWANQTDSGQNRLSPGADRWKERSRTYPGIADAMVDQWAYLIGTETIS